MNDIFHIILTKNKIGGVSEQLALADQPNRAVFEEA
jgi:hypothetical protein